MQFLVLFEELWKIMPDRWKFSTIHFLVLSKIRFPCLIQRIIKRKDLKISKKSNFTDWLFIDMGSDNIDFNFELLKKLIMMFNIRNISFWSHDF